MSGAAGAAGSARKRLLKEEDMTKVEFETSEEVDVTPTFDTMGLREDLLRGIYAYGAGRCGAGGAGAGGAGPCEPLPQGPAGLALPCPSPLGRGVPGAPRAWPPPAPGRAPALRGLPGVRGAVAQNGAERGRRERVRGSAAPLRARPPAGVALVARAP